MNNESLDTNIEVARQRKYYSGFGKEYYAVYIGYNQDAFVDYIARLVEQLYPKDSHHHWYSIPGVVFKIIDNCSKTFTRENDTIFIHKRKFRKCLRRAMSHSRVTR